MPTGMIPAEYITLIRNKEAVDVCAPLLYITIINWSCTKPQNETFEDYIDRKEILDKCGVFSTDKAKKYWKKNRLRKLKAKDLNGFDVTFLHELLPIICYEKITDQVKSLLKEVKDLRNDVSHEADKAKDPEYFKKLRSCISNCLTVAGPLFGKDSTEIDNKMKEVDIKFNKILEDTNQNYDTRITYIKELITNECIEELRQRCDKYNSVSLPGFNNKDIERCKIFHNVMLSMKKKENEISTLNEKKETVTFKCTELFNTVHGDITVINGVSGSGKTTLMKTILHDILKVEHSTKNFKGISKFLLPVFIECRLKTCEHLGELMKITYPKYLSDFPEKEVLDAIQKSDGLILLIDGYDEVNETSEQLVDAAISLCEKKNVTCIISGRLQAAKDAEEKLKEYDVTVHSVSIEQITKLEDQVELLQKYGNTLPNCDKLVEKFEQFSDVTREVFMSPILLALFCSLFIGNYLDSSFISEVQIYEGIYTLFTKQLELKLRALKDEMCPNPRIVSEQIMKELSKLSLKLFNEEEYFLTIENFDILVEDCKQICNMNINYEDLLSCVLSPEHSMAFNKVLTFQFHHSSIQEFMAARCIMQYHLYGDLSIKVTTSQLMDFMGFKDKWEAADRKAADKKAADRKDADRKAADKKAADRKAADSKEADKRAANRARRKQINRYKNLMKFVILILHKEGKTSQFSTAITHMMTEYFRADDEYGGTYGRYALDVIAATNTDAEIVKMFSPSIKGVWLSIEYTRHLKAASELIKLTQPSRLSIRLTQELNSCDELDLRNLLVATKNNFTGKLRLWLQYSHDHYKEIREETLLELKDAKCSIRQFRGCVTSVNVLKMLKEFGGRSEIVEIQLSSPVTAHSLHVLEGINCLYWSFKFTFKYTEVCPSQGSRPVPLTLENEPPRLRLTDVPPDGLANAVKIINFIAPRTKRFTLWLIRCGLSTEDLNKLAPQIRSNEVGTSTPALERWSTVECRTYSGGCSGCLTTHFTDTPPCYKIVFRFEWRNRRPSAPSRVAPPPPIPSSSSLVVPPPPIPSASSRLACPIPIPSASSRVAPPVRPSFLSRILSRLFKRR